MKKNYILMAMLFLFVGVNMQAQSVAEEPMDERFNDGTNLPYGWFTEGWSVKDGVIQTIEADGTQRFFDLQGRLLPNKPHKGIIINNNGKKFISIK